MQISPRPLASAPAPPAPVGNRRRQRTRRQLLDAARAVIAEKGIDAATIGEIAERADVAFGSFYNHFESKDGLVEALFAEIVADHAAASAGIDAELASPAERLARGSMAWIRQAATDPLWGMLLVRIGTGRLDLAAPLLGLVDRDVKAGQEAGLFDAAADAGVLVVMIAGAVYGAVYASLGVDPEQAEVRAAEVAASVLRLAGMAPAAARSSVARVQRRYPS